MQLSQKEKIFSGYFYCILKCTLHYQHFTTKDDLIADAFPKLRTPKNVVRYISEKSCLKGPFDRQHGK